MAREIEKLGAKGVEKKRKPGYHADGAGLYLQVSASGSKSWVFRYMRQGRAREMGLGSYNSNSLAEARQKAGNQRKLLEQGIDPISARDAAKLREALAEGNSKTFAVCAESYIDAHKAGWRDPKLAKDWANSLATHAKAIRDMPVQAIDTALVTQVLDPIWTTKTVTANRVRSRIELILDWAKVRGYRDGENPARWRGHLDKTLPNPKKVAKVEHRAAMPYSEVSAFMKNLRKQEGQIARALEFIVLTAARVSEAVNAKWVEIDWQNKVWIVPAERMKSVREHRVPLSDAAINLLKAQKEQSNSDYVFPGKSGKKPFFDGLCVRLLHDMGHASLTVHGFRSTFRDWAAEQTNTPSRIAEAALAHVVGDKTEAAYQRGDLLAKRRLLMQSWGDYCARSKSANVVPMGKRNTG